MGISRVGFRYRPDLEQLLKALKFKAEGGDMSRYSRHIVEMDLYGEGKEPWKLFSGSNEISDLHDVEDWKQRTRVKYVVTKLKKVKSGSKNYSRTAGGGSWDGQGTKPIECNGREIFQMGTLTYEFRRDPCEAAGKPHYWMHEYHLSDHSLQQIGLPGTDWVICRVIKDISKCCHVKKGKKRAISSATEEEDISKKAKKLCPHENVIPQGCVPSQGCSSSLLRGLEVFLETPDCAETCDPGGVIDEHPDYCRIRDELEGCVPNQGCTPSFMTLDDFPDLLFDDCADPGAISSGEKEDFFLDTPDCVDTCDLGGVIDEHPDYCTNRDGIEEVVDVPSSNVLNDYVGDEELNFSDLLFPNQENLEEEELRVDEYSKLSFGDEKNLEQCFFLNS